MLELRNFNVSVDANQSSPPHCHGQRSLLRRRLGFTVQDSCFYSHSHQVRYIYIQEGEIRGSKGPKGNSGKGNGFLTLHLTVPHINSLMSQTSDLGAGPGKLYTEEGSYNKDTHSQRKAFRKARV